MKTVFDRYTIHDFSDEAIILELYKKIRKLRRSCCISQTELAQKCAITWNVNMLNSEIKEYFHYLFYYHHPRQLNKIIIRPDIQLLRITHKRKYILFYLLYISCRKAFFQLLLELF